MEKFDIKFDKGRVHHVSKVETECLKNEKDRGRRKLETAITRRFDKWFD